MHAIRHNAPRVSFHAYLKILTTIILALCTFISVYAENMPHNEGKRKRPTIAVVLSGGGAKGAAHVGVLKVIEEAGVPIDMVVGTSMGAIVGGLYSAGYPPEFMDSLFRSQDWAYLLGDSKKRSEESFITKERQDSYNINIQLNEEGQSTDFNSLNIIGFVEGKNVMKMFTKLTEMYGDSTDFDKLPVRFACVSEDIVSGKEIISRSGRLDSAMRASMSIPGVFSPQKKDSMLLIDGGLLNNYPVDIARQMGADIVIGVDLSEGKKDAKGIKSMMDIMNQLISLSSSEKYARNKENTDIYINVNVKGYSSASFNKAAIDTLIARGTEAAMKKVDDLKELGEKVGGNEEYLKDRKKTFAYLRNELYKRENDKDAYIPFPNDVISLGANFESEEAASLMMQCYLRLPFMKIPSQAGVTARVGKRYMLKLDMMSMIMKGYYVDLSYEVGYNDVKFKHKGDASASTTFSDNKVALEISKSWKFAKIGMGARFNNYNFKNTLINDENGSGWFTSTMDGTKNYGDIFINANINTTNKKLFPTKGLKIEAESNIYLGNEVAANGMGIVYGGRFYGTMYCPVSYRFNLIPSLYFRALDKNSYLYGIYNIIGGPWEGHYLPIHIPFYGIGKIEWCDRTIMIAKLEGRMRIGGKHYVSGIINGGVNGNGFKKSFENKPLLGYGVSYSYDSFIGPLSVYISGSNQSDKVGVLFSFGYVF